MDHRVRVPERLDGCGDVAEVAGHERQARPVKKMADAFVAVQERVEDRHLVPLVEQLLGQDRAKEPRPPDHTDV